MEVVYGRIGAVLTLVTAEIGLAVALQLGAAIGATVGRGKEPRRPPSGQIPDASQLRTNAIAQHSPPNTSAFRFGKISEYDL